MVSPCVCGGAAGSLSI